VHSFTYDRLKQAPVQFRMFLLNSGALAGWLMILAVVLILSLMAPPAH
jgi:hypothetical protein